MHLHHVVGADTYSSMSDDDLGAHADNFFRGAAAAHPSLAHVVQTPTSRELKKRHGVDW